MSPSISIEILLLKHLIHLSIPLSLVAVVSDRASTEYSETLLKTQVTQ